MTLETFFEKFEQLADAPDAVAKMRELILELAVQGKLVEQRATEGNGHELLKQIQLTNPQRGIEIGAEVTDTAQRLPSNWARSTLGEVSHIIRGVSFPGTAKSESRSESDVACLRTASVQKEIDWDDLIYISPKHVSRPDQWVAPNDVMISMANSYALVGKVAIVRKVQQKATFGAFLASIRPIVIKPYFLLYVLRSPRMQAAFRASSSQTTNIANISLGRMRPLPFPLPPLAEQKRIVAKVDELMALCDRLEAQQQERETRHAALARASLARFAEAPTPANLNFLFHSSYAIPPADLRKSILTLAVQGKLVPQDPSDAIVDDSVRVARMRAGMPIRELAEQGTAEISFEAPATWRWVTVADVSDTRLGKMLDKEKNRGDAHPYLRNTNVHWFRFELESIKSMLFETSELDEYRVEDGDVLICEGGHGIARSAVWNGQVPGVMFQKALHRVRPLSCLDGHFLTYCLWVYERNEILQHYYTGAGIPHFTGKALARVSFPLPPLAEQRRIIAKVDQLMALVDQLEFQLTASRATAANLLEALVSELTSSNEGTRSKTAPLTTKDVAPFGAPAELIELHASAKFIHTVLAAEIIDRLCAHDTFGRVKLQKLLYLVEYHFQLPQIDSHPFRDAAGPHDPELIAQVQRKMADWEWFQEEPRPGSNGHRYRPLARAGTHRSAFEKLWPAQAPGIRALIDELKSWKTERCERFATLYAAWNDLLLWEEPVTDERILREVLAGWNPANLNIPKASWHEMLQWMKRERYIPAGFGRATAPRPQSELFSR